MQACTAASAAILTLTQRQRKTGVIWKLCLVVFTFVMLFIATMLWFVTNTFLLSTSFLAPPNWLERFEDELSDFIAAFSLAWFLAIVLPIMRWVQSIDFTFLMIGVQVTCATGSQRADVTLRYSCDRGGDCVGDRFTVPCDGGAGIRANDLPRANGVGVRLHADGMVQILQRAQIPAVSSHIGDDDVVQSLRHASIYHPSRLLELYAISPALNSL